jgi:hypothetical protein
MQDEIGSSSVRNVVEYESSLLAASEALVNASEAT